MTQPSSANQTALSTPVTAAAASPLAHRGRKAPRKILVLGATSGIAEATCRIWARDGASLFLVGRNAAKLEVVAADLRVRGAA